jgi:hypothetical protein
MDRAEVVDVPYIPSKPKGLKYTDQVPCSQTHLTFAGAASQSHDEVGPCIGVEVDEGDGRMIMRRLKATGDSSAAIPRLCGFYRGLALTG